jgi:hypothetical protein
MTRLSHEQLLGYLLGALDRQEGLEVEQAVAQDAELRSELEKIRASLDAIGLLDESEHDSPPLCLAARTCEFVEMKAESYSAETVRLGSVTADVIEAARELAANHPATARPKVTLSPVSRSEVAGYSYRKFDIVVACSVIVLGAALCFPLLFTNKIQAQVTYCQNHLRQLSTALHEFSQRQPDGAFPRVAAEGPRSVAGVYAPTLVSNQLVEDRQMFFCPGRPKLAKPSELDLPRIPTLDELDRATGLALTQMQSTMGGDFGFNFGYSKDGEILPPRNSRRANYALLADAPSDWQPGRNSANHAGRGQNVLFEDGQVRFVKLSNELASAASESALDDPYHNRWGKVAAGVDIADAVLGRSNDRPVPEWAP